MTRTSLFILAFLVVALSSIQKATSFLFRPERSLTSRRQPHYLLSSSSLSSSSATASLPRLSPANLQELTSKGYVIIENFLDEDLQEKLRMDVKSLREKSKFNIAKIGQDSTNSLNTDIRVAETCFVGPNKLADCPNVDRSTLYTILDFIRQDLPQPLDTNLSEFLYAYYPTGGFYRRHRDAIPGSASILRKYSLLLYLVSFP